MILVSLAICLAAFLLIFYALQDKKMDETQEQLLRNNSTRVIHSDTMDIAASLPLKLIPVPQKVLIMEGFYQMPEKPLYMVHDSLKEALNDILIRTSGIQASYSPNQGDIVVRHVNDLPMEGYRLEILPGNISIEFTNRKGLYYAFISLKILIHNHNGLLPCAIIEDYPDLAVRGLMVDISRNKIPTLETLKEIAQLIADLKYNHLELYIEGFSFAYPSFRNLWEKTETPLTGDEIKELDKFCLDHYIDLVPNQNSLGHMMAWLGTTEYADLAECPDGYKFMGLIEMKSTLDPSDPRSIELVTAMTDDLLPNFSSESFNVNLDEPFELGEGKSRRIVKEHGIDEVYLDYALKIHDLVTVRNKKMLMWGDIVLRHPEIIEKLPDNITLLDWGYESDYPFERNSRILQNSGKNFLLCPGTSSWTSITGRTGNMLANIASATGNAVKYGAGGILLTDWGDLGHWQYLPISYAGYVTAGALSWNSSSRTKLPLTSFLNDYVFRDSRQIMGHLALDLGRYMQFEEIPVPNMTTTMLSLQFGLNDRLMNQAIYGKITGSLSELMQDIAPEMVNVYKERLAARQPFDYPGFFAFLNEKEALLNNASINSSHRKQIADEYNNAIRLLRAGGELQFYMAKEDEWDNNERIIRLQSIRSLLARYLDENHRLWMLRNKPGGYELSTASLQNLIIQIDDELVVLQKPKVQRSLIRIGKMLKASAITLYLRFA